MKHKNKDFGILGATSLCILELFNVLDHSAFGLSLTKTSLDSVLPSKENGWDGEKLTLAGVRGLHCGEGPSGVSALLHTQKGRASGWEETWF